MSEGDRDETGMESRWDIPGKAGIVMTRMVREERGMMDGIYGWKGKDIKGHITLEIIEEGKRDAGNEKRKRFKE